MYVAAVVSQTSQVSLSSGVTFISLLIVGVLATACSFTHSARSVLSRRILGRYIVERGPEYEVIVDARWKRRLVGLGIGAIVGASLATAFVASAGADRSAPATGLLVLGSLAFASLGAAIGSVPRREIMRSSRRVAHSQYLTFADYVPAPVRWTARIVVLLSAGLLLTDFLASSFNPDLDVHAETRNVLLLLVVPALAMLALFEVIGRAIVSRPVGASSPHGLVIQDVVRVLFLRDMARAALTLGILAIALSGPFTISALNKRFPLPDPSTTNVAELIVAAIILATWAFPPVWNDRLARIRREEALSIGSNNP